MKPNFALSLSFDGIRLLHRAAGGWHLVGEVSVSDPNLTSALADLLQAGRAVKTRKLRSKLVIPDEQIKYLTIQTPGLDDDARRDAARVALDGATPYAVDSLAFDISPDGDATHVAAVARETLLEAEAFATEHKFNPVSFVAAAEGSAFLGEPFFGLTTCASSLLPGGATVEPDGVRVVIVDKPDDSDTADRERYTNDGEAAQAVESTQTSVDETQGLPDPTATRAEAEKTDSSTGGYATAMTATDKVTAAEVVKEDAATPSLVDVAAAQPPATADAMPTAPKPQAAKTTVAATPREEITTLAPSLPEAEDQPGAELSNDAEATTTPPLLGFATRRRQNPTSGAAPVRLGGASRDAPPQRTSPPVTADKTVPPRKAMEPPSLTAPPRSVADSLRPTPAIEAPISPDAAANVSAEPKARAGGFLSRRKPQAGADVRAAKSAARKASRAKSGVNGHSETERMTVFGAREGQAVGGKPRYLGLILMALLLVFLAGVAAWATVFMDEGLARWFPARERTLASTLPEDAAGTLSADVGATTELERDAEEEADDVVVAALNDSLTDDGLSAEDAAVLDALRDPLPDPIAPEEMDAAALEARYAVTGIWPKAPEMAVPADLVEIENLYVTGIDPISPALDAVALPSPASLQTDQQLALVTSPVAAGTNFARGLDGRLIPTPEGALSPDGFTVYLGRPPAVPPATLARLDAGPEQVNPNLNALTQVRPRPRPTDLVEQNERATLGGLSRTELAALRPRLRPQAPQEVEAIQQEEQVEDTPPSDLAAAVSLRPETRPRNFERVVARAVQSAPAAAASAAQPTAAVAPRSVAPAIPSSASVTRAATVNNAINLRQINLIGVYGTPSNRRALVRLGNGRYQKVEVGDRFDGGRVSAIGDSELRYQKGNRNVILKMPSG